MSVWCVEKKINLIPGIFELEAVYININGCVCSHVKFILMLRKKNIIN